MRICDIILESTSENLEADLNGLIISIKANGVTNVPTERLAMQLRKLGYSVDNSTVLAVLQDNPMIQVATIDNIEFANTGLGAVSGDENAEKKNKDKVENKAHKVALKNIKRK